MATDNQRIDRIRKILKKTYPTLKTQLHHQNPFQLLVATMLSAQCTDKQVNAVTPLLFQRLTCPQDFVDAPVETLEALIRSTGYFRNKAKNIKNCSKVLVEKFDGTVPDTLNELITLPGVGRKTANVLLGAAFGKPGMVVDTHVARISRRLDLTENKNPVKIEFDLMKVIPKRAWSDFSLQLVYFGRQYCTARNPKCAACPVNRLCRWPQKTS